MLRTALLVATASTFALIGSFGEIVNAGTPTPRRPLAVNINWPAYVDVRRPGQPLRRCNWKKPCTYRFRPSVEVALSARLPKPHRPDWIFDRWTGAPCRGGNQLQPTCRITMPGRAVSARAQFVRKTTHGGALPSGAPTGN